MKNVTRKLLSRLRMGANAMIKKYKLNRRKYLLANTIFIIISILIGCKMGFVYELMFISGFFFHMFVNFVNPDFFCKHKNFNLSILTKTVICEDCGKDLSDIIDCSNLLYACKNYLKNNKDIKNEI